MSDVRVRPFRRGDRVTLVAEQRSRVAAAAHLLRYFPDEREVRRRGVGSWLLGQAADWLRLAQVTRLLDYAWLEGTDPAGQSYDDYRAFLPAVGFRELTRTARGWTRERLTAGGGGRRAGAG